MSVAPAIAERITVFVLDDDEAVLRSLQFALGLEGFDVKVFRSGAEMLALAAFPPSACLIVDYRLPDGDGLAVVEALRGRGVALPAILITTDPSERVRAVSRTFGIRIVEKPELAGVLIEAVHSAMLSAPR